MCAPSFCSCSLVVCVQETAVTHQKYLSIFHTFQQQWMDMKEQGNAVCHILVRLLLQTACSYLQQQWRMLGCPLSSAEIISSILYSAVMSLSQLWE